MLQKVGADALRVEVSRQVRRRAGHLIFWDSATHAHRVQAPTARHGDVVFVDGELGAPAHRVDRVSDDGVSRGGAKDGGASWHGEREASTQAGAGGNVGDMARSNEWFIVFFYVPFARPIVVDRWMVTTDTMHDKSALRGYPAKDVSWMAFTSFRDADKALQAKSAKPTGSTPVIAQPRGFAWFVNGDDSMFGVKLTHKLRPDDYAALEEAGFDQETATASDYYREFGEWPSTTGNAVVDYESIPAVVGRGFMRAAHKLRDDGYQIVTVFPTARAEELESKMRDTVAADLRTRGKTKPDRKSIERILSVHGHPYWFGELNKEPIPPVPRKSAHEPAKLYQLWGAGWGDE